jgi:hypothetical protein
MAEVVAGLLFREAVEELSAATPQRGDRPFAAAFQQPFELGEGEFDRIEVGTVRRQAEHLGTHGLDRRADAGLFVAGQVIHDHDIAGT